MNGQPKKTSALAATSLVTGILGFILLPFIGSIIAIITGHISLSKIKNSDELSGSGLSIAGLILGYLGIILMTITIFAIAVPAYKDYVVRANIAQVKAEMKAIQYDVENTFSDGISLADINEKVPAYTPYTENIVVESGVIIATLKQQEPVPTALRGKTLKYIPVPQGQQLQWQFDTEITEKRYLGRRH